MLGCAVFCVRVSWRRREGRLMSGFSRARPGGRVLNMSGHGPCRGNAGPRGLVCARVVRACVKRALWSAYTRGAMCILWARSTQQEGGEQWSD